MNTLYKYIQEKLILNKDISSKDYSSEYGEGEIKNFEDCEIYKTSNYKNFNDPETKQIIAKYFNDKDLVWVITERFTYGKLIQGKILRNISKEISVNSKPLLQKVNLSEYQRGYYLKELNGQYILIVKDFLKNNSLKKIRYIFKI